MLGEKTYTCKRHSRGFTFLINFLKVYRWFCEFDARCQLSDNKLILDRVPAGRWGLPEDLVGALIFLSSPASDYVHGVVLPVDGGFLAR